MKTEVKNSSRTKQFPDVRAGHASRLRSASGRVESPRLHSASASAVAFRLRSTCWAVSILSLAALCLFTACSTTARLPEDEVLYTGISEIAYGHKASDPKASKQARRDTTGVITAVARAYNTIEDLLSGNVDARTKLQRLSQADSLFTPRQLDSLRREIALVDSTTQAVRTEVNAALEYTPNGSLFGSSSARWPFSFGLWFYNRFEGSRSAVGRWLFNSFAAQPRTVSMANPQLRVQVARQALRANGFFHGSADFDVYPYGKDQRKAKIAYSIYPGPLFRLGTIDYQRFGAVTDSLIRANDAKRLIHEGDPFSAANLAAERTRLSELFRNNGFYYYRPEFITFRADTLQTPFTAHLQVRPAPDMPPQADNRFYIGRTRITILPHEARSITDSLGYRTFKLRWGGATEKPPLRFGAIRHNLFYETGSLYRQRLHEFIQNKLSGMGVFSNIQMNYTPRDTSATCDTLDVDIFAILDKPWDSEFEAKVTNKSNGLLGPGVAWGMNKRNAFRGAETVNFKVYGSYEWQTGSSVTEGNRDRNLLNSFELGASTTLTYPRIRFFGLASKLNRRAEGSTSYRIEADWMNRSGYFRMVNFSGRLTYTYRRQRRFQHELTPLRLDYTMLTHRSERFDSIINANQALYVSMRNQLVPSMGYTLTYHRRWRESKRERTVIAGTKEAGNITSGIYALAGRSTSQNDKKLLGVPFAQFFKLTGEWRETIPLTARSSIATRLFAGAVWSYGNSTMAPYADLFNVGGANSIRAFAVRSIGPGCYHPANSSWSYVDQVGNLKLEANVEYRFPLVGDLEGALFLDAGNVWLMHPDEARPGGAIEARRFGEDIALGTGAGFRYDLDFLVLRFDIGVGLHAPYDTGRRTASGRRPYYNMRRFWDSLGFHIAVGYPF
ncbi:MAG: BamA/TamA family outer membrane protein [Bacteroidales bacterium]|nr:BamA/TamA family outer membrane protein [Bacteroidales bacterium]